VQTVQRQ